MSKRSNQDDHYEEDEPRKRVQLDSEKAPLTGTIATVAPGVSRWTVADIAPCLPPLPPISPELEEQVFRHPGLGAPNYERLEWYGDAALEMISTELVFETFDYLPTGRSSQLREQLVRNITLADYYRQYGMQYKTKVPMDMGSMVDLIHRSGRDKETIKIQGDVFEAYVGAVVKSDPQHGAANAVAWLKALWAQTIKDQIKQAEQHRKNALKGQRFLARSSATTAPTNQTVTTQAKPTAEPKAPASNKERLSRAIVVRGIKLRYEDMPCNKKDKNLNLPLFTVGVYLDGWGEAGKLLGFGTALGKKEAGEKAAKSVLDNRKQLKVYEAKKEAWIKEAQEKEPVAQA
ncbi:ribonuclease III [Fusarium pseudoanthophilum]|uniref:Ribonuclease III n=1 Tax=Fusarium pseudoanthophilum TaxID=48495 RepID=A0A8H5LAR5_9HYPO|nr:ribonuclease III [Fusarium pseudoanthophilum]